MSNHENENENDKIQRLEDGVMKTFKRNVGSGIHTTIMPSPGTTQNNIPGKFSFECDEYIEKLSFDLVPGGVRNRGGANEQFCGAVKYEQSIRSVSHPKDINGLYPGIHEENGMYLWLTDLYKNPATNNSIEKDRGVHNWNTPKGKAVLLKKLYGTDDIRDALKKELDSLNRARGVSKNAKRIIEIQALIKDITRCINQLSAIVKANPYLDVTLYNIGEIDNPSYTTKKPENLSQIKSIVPPKELQPGEGIDRPTYVPDYSISRSGVIPHGSTITLLGDLKKGKDGYLINGAPQFINSNYAESKDERIKLSKGTWDKEHLTVSDSMGTGISDVSKKKGERPFDLYNPPPKFIPTEKFDQDNDPGEQEVYTQQIFLHDLYPYTVRPDLRLNDIIKKQHKLVKVPNTNKFKIADLNNYIKNHVKIEMFTKKDEGTQGGIINIPFVNKFVPTVNMKMNMWLETVIENGKELLQLQYEQIVFFEFGFGDGGGTTSWPHIQVNTLRQYKDLNKTSKDLADEQFIKPAQEALRKKVEKHEELTIPKSSGCPFGQK